MGFAFLVIGFYSFRRVEPINQPALVVEQVEVVWLVNVVTHKVATTISSVGINVFVFCFCLFVFSKEQ